MIPFKRIIKNGIVSFFRNGLVSVASVLVMSLSILMLGSVLVGTIFLHTVIQDLEAKVNVSVYFKQDAPERSILKLRQDLQALPEVTEAQYISRDDALKRFLEAHKNDEIAARSIDVLGENPFSASLEVRATDPAKYDTIAKFIEQDTYRDIIDIGSAGRQEITYRQNQFVIDHISSLLRTARAVGVGIGIVLGVIALVVAYNTVRLAIYNARDEISVMQLVGASRSFIRGPFLVEGVIQGVIAALITLLVLYPSLWWFGAKTQGIFGGPNILDSFTAHWIEISSALLLAGVLLGALSSTIAMRRYLKV